MQVCLVYGNYTYLELVISVALVPDETLCALLHNLGLVKRLDEHHGVANMWWSVLFGR